MTNCRVGDDILQHTLLAVAKLTCYKAYQLALLHKSAAQNSCLLNTTLPTQPVPVHHSIPQPAKSYRCGGSHSARTCCFKDYKCNFCYKNGHIQRTQCRAHKKRWSHLPHRHIRSNQAAYHSRDTAPATAPCGLQCVCHGT